MDSSSSHCKELPFKTFLGAVQTEIRRTGARSRGASLSSQPGEAEVGDHKTEVEGDQISKKKKG